MSIHRTLPIAVLLFACRSDDGGITKFIQHLKLKSYRIKAVTPFGDVVEFVGKVTDANHDMSELTTVWVGDGNEVVAKHHQMKMETACVRSRCHRVQLKLAFK